MLDRKGKGLDLQEVRVAKQTIDIDAQGMSGELGVETGTETPEGMGMVSLDVKLFGQLSVDGLDDLAHAVEEAPHGLRQLPFLIASG